MFDSDFKKRLTRSVKNEINPEEVLKYISAKMPTPPIQNFNLFTPSVDIIMELTKKKPVDVDRLHEYDNFDLLNPTDWSKPNFISSIQKWNERELSSSQKKELDGVYAKSVNPIRLSLEDALIVEQITQDARWQHLRNINKKVTDHDYMIEQMLFISYLSPEAYASCFFFHNKYGDEHSKRFSSEDINVRPFQKAFLNCNNNHVALLVSRQEGKSTILQIMMTWYLIFRPGFRGFFIAQLDSAVKTFIKELYSKDGSVKIHPYLTGNGVDPQESFGELRKVGINEDLHYRVRINGELSNIDSVIKMSYARGDKRFTGTTNQGLFFDEIATYDVDPTGSIGPTLDSFKHMGFTYYTTTQRDGGNPFIPIMNRPDVRLFQRNIWFSYYTGTKTDEDLQEAKSKSAGNEIKWQTEYECVIPESMSSILTKTDLQIASRDIDNKFLSKISDKLEKQKTFIWEMRDYSVFEHYKLVEFNIGVDWNQDAKGNFISVNAVVYDKDEDRDEAIKHYKYISFDFFHITGNQYMYNTLATLLLLMDKYNVEKIYADSGGANAMKQILAISPELHKTKNGKLFYVPGNGDAQPIYPGIEFISFQRIIKQQNTDSFNTTHETKLRLREALITTSINLIKKRKLLFSAFESKYYKLTPDISYSYIGTEEDVLRSDSEAPFVLGSRILNVKDQTKEIDVRQVDLETFDTSLFNPVLNDYTFVDEIKNLSYNPDQKKYVSPTKGALKEMEDDRTIAMTLSLYPSIQKYETYFLEGVEDEVKIDKKESESIQLSQNLLEIELHRIDPTIYNSIAELDDEDEVDDNDNSGVWFI